MLEFSDARRQILAAAQVLESESVTLADAAGRVLAETLHASTPLPPFDYSAMDGYALRSTDVNGNAPWELPVNGECRAGDTPVALVAGSALRIFTGAPLPTGADAVLIQENVTRTESGIRFTHPVAPLENVRRAGEDLASGAIGIGAGTRLGPFHLGLVAALDRDRVRVSRRPRVVIVPTGNELRAAGSAARPGSIPESNSVALLALCAAAGADARLGSRLADETATAAAAFRGVLGACDLLVTVGGVSVGDHDIVRPALTEAGAALEFWKVAIKPGKPLTFGRAGRTLILGLPGNPVSAQLTFALFGMPLLRALQGDAKPLPPALRVVLAEPLRQKPGRLGVYRARLEANRALLDQNQASGSTVSLALADALVFVPKDVSELEAGSELDAVRLAEL
ncbi:MAG TPA: gephyrin-like molybdotransferase Glp [Polyangiaceae bacterium]|nr:gephyrin-like molybdotransferase Glp [Polyangiaceae bacterium]